MNPNSPSYGEGATLETMKAGAPLAGAGGPPAPGGASPIPNGLLEGLTGLDAPSGSTDPVTSGAARGAGPGVAALGIPQDAAAEDRADREAIGPATLNAL